MWIDRQTNHAKNGHNEIVLGQLSSTLGSGFNLTTATVFRFMVSRRASSGLSATIRQAWATPGCT